MGQQQIREGSPVTWSWGKGTAEGKVVDIFREEVSRTLDGAKVTKNGSSDNPAYLIEQEDGSQVLKLRSELQQG